MNNPWKKLGQRYVYEHHPFLKIRCDKVIAPNGERSKYSIAERPDVVTIIAKDDKNYVYFVKQWRYPINQESIELPMGGVDEGESLETAARRELKEETGLDAEKLIKIAEFHPSPGLVTNKNHVFIAKDFKQGNQELDPIEDISIQKIKIDEIENVIKKGEIKDNLSISSFYLYKIFNK